MREHSQVSLLRVDVYRWSCSRIPSASIFPGSKIASWLTDRSSIAFKVRRRDEIERPPCRFCLAKAVMARA